MENRLYVAGRGQGKVLAIGAHPPHADPSAFPSIDSPATLISPALRCSHPGCFQLRNMPTPRFSLRNLINYLSAVFVSVGAIVSSDWVFYYQGRAGIPLALLLFWGGVLVLVVASAWFLNSMLTRR
jgi:hypothetical protein